MTTTASEHRDPRWLVLLLAAVLTFATTVLLGVTAGVGVASAATVSPSGGASAVSSSAAGTRVGASTTDLILAVGVDERIAAGQGRGDGPSQCHLVSGLCVAAEDGPANAVIGKVGDLDAPGAIGDNEYTLLDQLPNKFDPKLNWQQNSSVLRQEMSRGVPIRDASIDPATGELLNNTGFLRAERNLLETKGWTYDPKTGFWSPGG